MLLRATLLALLAATSVRGADRPKAGPITTEGETVQLPDMQVFSGYTLKDFTFPRKADVAPADLRDGSALPNIHYPGKAYSAGVRSGQATVAVMLDQAGQPTDFLLVRYTQPYFGEEVMYEAHQLKYSPRRLRGQPVPGSFHFTYRFSLPNELAAMNSFEAASQEIDKVGGGPRMLYEPRHETDLDAGQLEPVRLAIPTDPVAPPVAGGPPFRMLVTFYVDEQGRLRLPNVESDATPEQAERAIRALLLWTFKPPTIRGRPVLVHAARALAFQPAGQPAAPAPEGGAR